ncbi:hypothetical protein BYT27DRAFT_7232300 [Phlegmacium glaucopus]|nr:hypothetical protein BYT27DRAFT_7232300 [Phlegmacium glaucopus]
MPLDSHSYLVSQGWGGKGTGLRQGAISRPLAIPPKKNLAGLGKDRDEAFPFWDHLFSAAAKSIQIKCLSDDDEEENGSPTNSSNNNTSIKCTSTGILSNRRPIDGTPATSGTNTPEIAASGSQPHRLGLLAAAKRDAAKRGLYSKFFRGPVLGPDTIIEEEKHLATLVSQAFSTNDPIAKTVSIEEIMEIQTADENVRVNLKVSKSKRKARETKESGTEDEDEETKRERKRQRKEKKEKKAERREKNEKEKHRENTEDTEANSRTFGKSSLPPISQKDQKIEDIGVIEGNTFSGDESQADRRWRKKEEKKRLKRLEKAQAKDVEKSNHGSKSLETKCSGNSTKLEICSSTVPEVLNEPKKRKKKRKHADAE